MKKLLLFVLLVSGISKAQVVTIPDPEFKAALIYLGVDTNSDGNIQNSEALATTSLDFNQAGQFNVLDLTGFEAFTNLTTLNFGDTYLIHSLDVSALTALAHLEMVHNNYLTSITLGNLPNLAYLDCNGTPLTALDVSGAPNLTYLDCSQTYITSLDVSTLTHLTHLDTNSSKIFSLDLSHSPDLGYLDCAAESLYGMPGTFNLNIAGCVHITHLDVNFNALTTLNVTPLTELQYLDVGHNAISVLDVANLSGLTYLNCNGNSISDLNVDSLTNLTYLNCNNNQLSTLAVSALNNLTELHCYNNQIPSIDVSGLTNLIRLECGNNQLTTLNITPLIHLIDLDCRGNLFTNLDVSANTNLNILTFGNPNLNAVDVGMLHALTLLSFYGGLQHSLNLSGLNDLQEVSLSGATGDFDLSSATSQLPSFEFYIAGNPDLTYLNLKTGHHFNCLFGNNPQLTSVCTNESDLQNVTTSINIGMNFPENIVVSSYCSFTPGGSYNTVAGHFHFDADNNGCTSSDVIPPSVKVNINDGTTAGSTFTNLSGGYGVYSAGTNIVLTPQLENPTYFNVTPTSQTVTFPDADNHTATSDFCMTANGVHPDLEVLILPLLSARPGFDAHYQLLYKNKGNQTLSGQVAFNFDDSRMDFVSAIPNPDSQSTGNLTFDFTNLLPFETRTAYITININSPVETLPVNIDDVLTFTASIDPVSGDETPADNTFSLPQIVRGSFDPNEKTCLQGNVVSTTQIGEYLYYSINFENTGTLPAQNVAIKDIIDTDKFDISSLQVFSASHDDVVNVTGNRLEILFENIGLEPNEYGYVAFKIKTINNLALGSTVSNTAGIYFDFNAPVVTNTASTTFVNLGIDEHSVAASVRVYPNPAQHIVNVQCDSAIRSITVFDLQGRLMGKQFADTNQRSFDISTYAAGIYYLNIVTDKGKAFRKLVKE